MSLFQSVQDQIKSSFKFIKDDYDISLLEDLLFPNQIIEIPISILMDDGSIKTFIGYRSQHNNVMWPYKWGLRFHPNVSKDEVMSLSTWMTLKTSVAGLPLGGGKGGIAVDPKKLSTRELELLSRTFMRKLARFIGPDVDVPAPDVNTTPQIMAWMVDEYSQIAGKWTPGVITGKPVEVGWSLWRNVATSLWGFFVLSQYLQSKQDSLKGKSIAIQWAGNVWLHFAKIAESHGAKIVSISDSKWWIYHSHGISIAQIQELKSQNKSVTDCKDAKKISNEDLLELSVDILVPAALENVIDQNNANKIRAKIILELANGPVTHDADTILAKKNIAIIPDILANAGGVTVSYFEQVQNNSNYYRSKDEVNDKLETIIKPATTHIMQISEHHQCSLREWAYILAIRRILDAKKLLS